MQIAQWLRGAVATFEGFVDVVFNDGRTAIAGAPYLPTNIKTDLTNTLNDAESDLHGLEGLAGSVGGEVAADAVDDVTSLLMGTAQNVAGSGSDLTKMSVAEKTLLLQTWSAMKAQGDTIVAQLHAGLLPAGPAPITPPVAIPTVAP